jgi:predicted phosphoribosyltransferase
MAEIHGFKDRAHAGALLAPQLRRHAHAPDAVVLALPRGGVPAGFAIAHRLGVMLDVLVVRKLAPQVDELVCLSAPPLFRSVGQWYDAFDQTSDEQVQALLTAARRSQGASHPPTGGRHDENTDDG